MLANDCSLLQVEQLLGGAGSNALDQSVLAGARVRERYAQAIGGKNGYTLGGGCEE
jgi:hypothetical protein